MSHSSVVTLIATPLFAGPAPATAANATDVKVTVISTMLAGAPSAGVGEWGFAAVLEVGGRRLLIDTGARPETVLKNAVELKVDLASPGACNSPGSRVRRRSWARWAPPTHTAAASTRPSSPADRRTRGPLAVGHFPGRRRSWRHLIPLSQVCSREPF